MPNDSYAIVGRIRKAQGIRGEVVIEPITDTPDVIYASGVRVYAGNSKGDVTNQTLTVEHAKPFKSGYIVKFAEIPDRNAAELWRNRYVLAKVEDLPERDEGEVYLHELVGLTFRAADGENVGSVLGFYELPTDLMLEIQTDKGTILIPYRPEIVQEVDLDAKTVTAVEGVEELWR